MNSKRLLDWLYPRRCAFCDEVLGNMEKYLCHSCQRRMPKPIGEPNCKKCGKPLLREEQEYCYDCNRQEPSFTRAKGLFLYEDPLKESLMGLKFRERKEYGIFLGRLMGLCGADFIRQVHPQVIFPVPIHRKKKVCEAIIRQKSLHGKSAEGFPYPFVPIWYCGKNPQKHRKS